jgi:hypothetical protein
LRLDGNTISRWERGDQIPQPHHVILLCRLFGMTAADLGLGDTTASAGQSAPAIRHPDMDATSMGLHATLDDEQPMDRREFSKAVTASLIGGLAIVDWDRLARPTPDHPSLDDFESMLYQLLSLRPGQIGASEVAELEQAVCRFERWDAQSGGAPWRKAVVGQLRTVIDLLTASYPAQLHQRLFNVTAKLAQLAGWTAYDSRLHQSARRYYLLALQAAERADDPLLGAKIMGDMAQLANALGNHDDELTLLSTALRLIPAQIHPPVLSELLGLQARAYAQLGQDGNARRSIDACIGSYSTGLVATMPDQPHYLSHAEIDCLAANAYIEMALRASGRSEVATYAAHADQHTTSALSVRSRDYTRSRVLDTIRLAYVRLVQAEPAEAAALATTGLQMAASISSARVIDRMVMFRGTLRARYPASPQTGQFEHELRHYVGEHIET